MNNNLLLESAIRNNPVCFDLNDILIDEFFQIIRADIDNNGYVETIVFRPLNYQRTKRIISHHVCSGKNFHNINGEIIRFMIDKHKSQKIDNKHDNLRKAIYQQR